MRRGDEGLEMVTLREASDRLGGRVTVLMLRRLCREEGIGRRVGRGWSSEMPREGGDT
jgi:hypothetical protein